MTGHSCTVVVAIILSCSTRAKACGRSRLEIGDGGVRRREPKGFVAG